MAVAGQIVSAPANRNDLPWLHGGDLIVRQLEAFGVRHLFTLTGGHISPIFDAARFTDVTLVDFRHEQAAVHAADAYARLSRDVSVAALTAGPGVTGGITGVANAFYAESPVVVLGGRNPCLSDGAGNLQEAPHIDMLRPVTKYCATIFDNRRATEVTHDAFAAARAPRSGPAYIDIPVDVQLNQMLSEDAPRLRKAVWPSRSAPDPDAVKRVARYLAEAHQPVAVVGTGAYWSGAEQALDALTGLMGMPVYLNGMARGLLGRHHPYQIYANRKEALRAADLVLLIGVDLDFRFNFGQTGTFHDDAVIVQIDADGSRIGRNRDVTLGVTGDIRLLLEALAEQSSLFEPLRWQRWLEALRDKDRARQARMREMAHTSGRPVHPMQFVQVVAEFLDEDATVVGDGGDIVSMFASGFHPGGPGRWMDPGPFGCLGVGAPFAIGARLRRPDTQIAVIFGDGSFGFNGFEYDSAVRQNLPFVGVIGNDGAWGEMRTFHEDLFGDADMTGQYLSQKTGYEKVVEGLGGHGERVEDAAQIRPALERAFKAGVPALVNVILDPSFRRANSTISGRHVAVTLGRGDKDAFKR